ncbi:MAG: hypothetical protein EOR94_27465 [Mesorhizobium sp.]|nr:MAG: hypothetical protein EOR94_27465 [Mesorhizobium sp.]
MRLKEIGRSKRFKARLAVERSILDIVNSSDLSQAVPLAGLTIAAIGDWRFRAGRNLPDRLVSDIEALLISISRESGLLADNSRAVFDPENEAAAAAIGALKAKLALALS